MNDSLLAIICFLLVIILLVISGIINAFKSKQKAVEEQKIFELIEKYNVSLKDGELTIGNKGNYLSDIIKICKENDYSIGYKPQEVHLGAVTVGGVTSGGTYTTGGYNYATGASSSGKYSLRYLDVKGKTINLIRLPHNLYQQAEQSSIAEYLDNKKHGIAVIDEHVQYTEAELIELRLFARGQGGTSHAVHKAYPDYNKCIAIMNWLTQD